MVVSKVGSKLAKLLTEGIEDLIKKPEVTPEVKPKPKPKDKPKAKSKAGRKRKPRGVKAATPRQKDGAREAGMSIPDFRALSEAEQKKWMKVDKPKAAPKVKRTRKEERELGTLIGKQKEEMLAAQRPPKRTSTGNRRKKLTPEGQRLFDAGEFDEIIANPKKYMTHGVDAPLRPKGTELPRKELARMKRGSPEEKAQAIREMLNDPGYVVGTPSQVSPQLRGSSKSELEAMEKELRKIGGFEFIEELKGGGRLKYYKKGGRIKKSSRKPRGVGAALRGYGKAMKHG